MVSDLSRKPILMLLLTLSILAFSLTTFPANATNSSPIDLEINRVDHTVQIQDGGLVVIRDVVNVSLTGENIKPQRFSIGFPFEYASNLVYCFAYNTSDPSEKLEVTLDTGLGEIGFYGVNITLPTKIIKKASYSFTVVFVFSDLIKAEPKRFDSFWWNTTFPLYPSLTRTASICNVRITLPQKAENITVEWYSNLIEKGLNVSTTTIDSCQVLQFSKAPLESFVSESAWVRFYQLRPSEANIFLMIDANEVRRDITLDEWGRISVSDFYHITNKGEWNLTSVKLRLPQYAFDISWVDEEGRIHDDPLLEGNETTSHINATISFGTALQKNEETEFTVNYMLPWKEYVTQSSWRNFNLDFRFFEGEYFEWTVEKLYVTINLPRGADFKSCSVPPQSIKESITFTFYNITSFHNLDFHLTYEHIIFWASFYPTLWVGLSMAVVWIIAILWRAPKPPPSPVIPVSPKALRSFVDTYERKTRAIRELEMLEQQVRKRKIPRTRYRVRKKALEGRLSVLSKDLAALKEEIRKAGSRYANAMRQIEVAETELEETETAIRRIELRYRRREISKGTYHKLLEEYTRRKERAETTIDGVLLRLREEIR